MSSPLPHTLRLLADAMDLLADCIEQQRFEDIEAESRELAVLVQRLRQKRISNIQSPAGQPLLEKRRNGYLLEWLQQLGITVIESQANLRADSYLHQAAEYLVNNFNFLHAFYKAFKYGQGQQKDFTFKTNAQTIRYIREWCKMLHDQKFIDRYEVRANGDLFIDVSSLHDAIVFINGFWLEIILRGRIANWLQKQKDSIQHFDVLSGVKIMKENGTPSEFDLLLCLNGKVFWFECKSGHIGDYYEIFNEHRRMLSLDANQSGMIITKPNSHIEQNAKKRAGMSTFDALHMDKLEKFIFTLDKTPHSKY